MDIRDKEIEQIIKSTRELDMPEFDKTGGWENISEQIDRGSSRKMLYLKVYKYAAIIIMGIVIGVLLTYSNLNGSKEQTF